jgi:peptidoglycan/LPS O-acetylase OafA/YrhL
MQSQVVPGQTGSATRGAVRLHYLDWLRVLAVLTIFVFHSGRFFDEEPWHVKNPTTYFGMTVWTYFLAAWLMPLVFVISGASIFYALGKGGVSKYVKDKALRLLVPLVVGACTTIALQVYVEYRFQGRFSGSFWAFLPHYFDGWREFGGNFAWTGLHLWYLLALFVFSLVFLPLFLWLKSSSGSRLLAGLGRFLAKPGAVYLLALPGTLMAPFLNPDGLLTKKDWGGWGLPIYIPLFLAGFLFVSHESLRATIRRQRWFSFAAGAVVFISALVVAVVIAQGELVFGTDAYRLFWALFSLFSWSFVLAILGFGMQHLTFSTPFLRYANEAVLPFYILHQTVIICVGYFVVRWAIPDLLKFVVIALSSFAIIMALYELLVRRFNAIRVLFGMKWRAKQPLAQPGQALLARPE